MAWRDSWLFHRIADWQSKPVTSWRAIQSGAVLLAIVLIGVFLSFASPTWGERSGAFAVALLAFSGALWFLREAKQ